MYKHKLNTIDMKNINAIKQGNVINLSIDGKLHKKVCSTPKEANELFQLALNAKDKPNDDNIKALRMFLNEKTRMALMVGLEVDNEDGQVYLEGFNTPIPTTLVEVFKEYYDNGFPYDAILNFWKLLMINPDKRVRESLFQFITTHDFVLTDNGYMVVYKSVYYKDENKSKEVKTLEEFVSNQYLFVKNKWKCSPNKYIVYRNRLDDSLAITKKETYESWDDDDKNVELVGKLGKLFVAIVNADNKEADPSKALYTDMHTRKMSIQLGIPARQERKECDSDPAKDCSNGLHVGATKYVEKFADSSSIVLVCLVNPAHVVAVPEYEHSKMRVCEYFPYALATFENSKIEIVEEAYFESDYCAYEKQELEEAIAKVKGEEKPIAAAKGADEESRPMAELMKILESRLIDIE